MNWVDFFQFSKDDTFNIIEEDGIINGRDETKIGDGKVIDISDDQLILKFNIPNQTIEITSILANILGISSVDTPKITGTLSLNILDFDNDVNRLEAIGTYIDDSGTSKSFSYTDTKLQARLRSSGNRIRLNVSDSFLEAISNDSNINMLGRLEFEKTGDTNTTEMDIGKLPLGGKIDFFLERNQ